MKWFKHLTEASHDEKLAEVLEVHGASGYGVFWLIVEAVAMQMDKTRKCEVKYSMKRWAAITHVDSRTLAKYLQTFSNLVLVVLQDCDKFVTISIPKLLDLRDNHTRNLQVPPKPSGKQEVDVEVDVDINYYTKENGMQRITFKKFEDAYPSLRGVKAHMVAASDWTFDNEKKAPAKSANNFIHKWLKKALEDQLKKDKPQQTLEAF